MNVEPNQEEVEKAMIGDEISFMDGARGIVEKVYENSVMVKVIENHTDVEFSGNKTIVAHKNYTIS
ncbi:DUF2187 family protein [Virgibacillus xinjiangensis]|uniref:DUF2187 family protein n=1 Tax=Virgibacillus xinjiangensis TaxID=393090 RepID=A0ABV7CWX3_9BACI